MPRSGRYTEANFGNNCDNWTSDAANHYGTARNITEVAQATCDVPRPLACCGD